jgi:hypothetical protein
VFAADAVIYHLCAFNGAVPPIMAIVIAELSQPSEEKPFSERS